jgi:hypothetical protein
MFHSIEALTSVSLFAATTRLGVEVDVVSVVFGVFPHLPPDDWTTLFAVDTALGEALGGAIIWMVL